MSKQKTVGIIILIIAVGIGGYLFGSQKKTEKLPVQQPSPTFAFDPTSSPTTPVSPVVPTLTLSITEKKDAVSDWLTYTHTDNTYSFQYPADLVPKTHEDGSVAVEKWGPTQEADTEFYDGISVVFTLTPNGGRILEEIVAENRTGTAEVWGEEIEEAKKITTAGVDGYTYSAMGHDYYFYMREGGYYLEVFNMTSDPGNLGYEEIAKQILSTLVLD